MVEKDEKIKEEPTKGTKEWYYVESGGEELLLCNTTDNETALEQLNIHLLSGRFSKIQLGIPAFLIRKNETKKQKLIVTMKNKIRVVEFDK